MCGRLNQFASLPALSLAGKKLRIERRPKKKDEDRKAETQVIHNICPTDYANTMLIDLATTLYDRGLLTMETAEQIQYLSSAVIADLTAGGA